MKAPQKHVPWSHADKFLILVLGLVLAVCVGVVFGSRRLDQNPDISVPTPVMPSPNAYDYYVRAGNAVTGSNIISPATRQPATPTAAQVAVVRQNAPAIALLHQGFHYPYHAPPVRSFLTPAFSQYAKLRGLARFLALEGRVNAAQGDWAGAMNADLDCVRMGEDMNHGSGLIGMLTGSACESVGRRHTWEAVDHLSAAQAKAAIGRLEGIRARHVPFADIMQEEEWQQQAGLLELMRQRDWPGSFLGDLNTSGSGNLSLSDTLNRWKIATSLRMTSKQTIMTNYTSHMDQVRANSRLPYATHPADPPLPGDVISQTLCEVNFQEIRTVDVRADTLNALLLTLLALRAYKLEHGVYPATLAALAPAYLKAVPNDPFALSGPLRYKKSGRAFVLYSVGPDGKDDGGKPIFDQTKPAPPVPSPLDYRYTILPDSQGDIVAGVNIS